MHDHDHGTPGKEGRFIFSLALTAVIFLAEFIGGLRTGSWRCFPTRPMSSWTSSPWD